MKELNLLINSTTTQSTEVLTTTTTTSFEVNNYDKLVILKSFSNYKLLILNLPMQLNNMKLIKMKKKKLQKNYSRNSRNSYKI